MDRRRCRYLRALWRIHGSCDEGTFVLAVELVSERIYSCYYVGHGGGRGRDERASDPVSQSGIVSLDVQGGLAGFTFDVDPVIALILGPQEVIPTQFVFFTISGESSLAGMPRPLFARSELTLKSSSQPSQAQPCFTKSFEI